MASNNPNQQQHPLHPPPPTGATIAGGGAGGGGIGRSAPIRTLPITPGPPLAVPYSLPGGLMATPPLVKSKLPLTPGRGASSTAAAPAPIAAAHATGRPLNKLPPSIPPSRPPLPQQPPPTSATAQQYQSANQSYDPFAHPAPSTPGVTNDPIASSRITPGTENDPVVLARQSPGVVATVGAASHAATAGGVSAELQPHIVPLPPPTQTAFHPLNANAGVSASGLGSPPRQVIHRANIANAPQQQQQQHQNYGVYSQQQQSTGVGVATATGATAAATGQHPLTTSLKQPPSTTPFKQPPQPQQQQPQQPQTSSSPTKQPQPHRTTAPSPSTPDGEIDVFLRGADYNTNPINCKVRPSPLPPSQSTLAKSKTLASRRAWGDVIRVTNDALLGKEAGVHHCCYSELSGAAKAASGEDKPTSMSADASTIATGAELDKLRQETAELIALRFVSQLKLRRYADLGQEIKHLGLMPFLPDHAPFPHAAIEGIMGDIGASSSFPSSPGTSATETSIDMLSSSPVKTSQNQKVDGNKIEEKEEKPMAWKEGSIHSSHHSDPLPSWVPFGLRILAAHQLQYNDGPAKAVDVLYDLRDRTTRTDYWGTQGMEIWTPTIDNALVNVFVRKREWRLALKALEDLMDGLSESDGGGGGGSVSREVDWWCAQGGIGNLTINVEEDERRVIAEVITAAAHVELLSRQLLILLQSGAVSAAETIQNDVRLHAAEVQSLLEPTAMTTTLLRVANESALVRQVTSRQMVNEGLVLFARCQYTEAVTYFRDALSRQRELEPQISSSLQAKPPGCPTWKDLSSPTLGFDAEPSLTVECLNNLSLCLLYSGHMRSSVQELEGLIREDPCLYLTEGMAFNLCTLYELGSDGEECTKKKKLLQRVAKRFYLHDVGVESFRLG